MLFDIYSTENSTTYTYIMYCFASSTEFSFCKYVLMLNVMPAACFMFQVTGETKDWESCGMIINTCLDQSTGKQVKW